MPNAPCPPAASRINFLCLRRRSVLETNANVSFNSLVLGRGLGDCFHSYHSFLRKMDRCVGIGVLLVGDFNKKFIVPLCHTNCDKLISNLEICYIYASHRIPVINKEWE